ncbi:hypothetical protein [Peribacillus simplex]|uniref:hypothetical protein n=1 Tax=Peribacillus simplex TaxID=1478 RepID=UPI00333D6038
MKKKFGILVSIFIVLTGFFLFTKPYKNKTKSVEDFIKEYPRNQVIIHEMMIYRKQSVKSPTCYE